MYDMNGRKTAVWEDALGQRIVFDNKTFFLESIDMTGTSGVNTVENLAFADGQKTIRRRLGAKTISCSFSYNDIRHDEYIHKMLPKLFIPSIPGKLTVFTPTAEYSIDCSPQAVPVYSRDQDVSFVYRWNVDFIADFPYWRKGSLQNILVSDIPTVNSNRILTSYCPFEIAPEIYLPESNASTHIQLYALGSTSKSFTVKAHENFPVRVKTLDFKVINDNTGEDQNQLIDATAELDKILIKYGNNIVVASPIQGVRLQYYELSMGEV